jgi:very-short-patch-repair endonuclease
LRLAIEADGQQHFSERSLCALSGDADPDAFSGLRARDLIKTNFMREAGHNFVRISYTEAKRAEEIIRDVVAEIRGRATTAAPTFRFYGTPYRAADYPSPPFAELR